MQKLPCIKFCLSQKYPFKLKFKSHKESRKEQSCCCLDGSLDTKVKIVRRIRWKKKPCQTLSPPWEQWSVDDIILLDRSSVVHTSHHNFTVAVSSVLSSHNLLLVHFVLLERHSLVGSTPFCHLSPADTSPYAYTLFFLLSDLFRFE